LILLSSSSTYRGTTDTRGNFTAIGRHELGKGSIVGRAHDGRLFVRYRKCMHACDAREPFGLAVREKCRRRQSRKDCRGRRLDETTTSGRRTTRRPGAETTTHHRCWPASSRCWFLCFSCESRSSPNASERRTCNENSTLTPA
jgi:hypothetical protein